MSVVEKRFWSKVRKTQDCWVWTAGLCNGYGFFWLDGGNVYAHRYAYESLLGPISDDLQLDHLCRNRACVNPLHLEQVARRTNILRGAGITAQNAAKAACKHGHPFDEINTGWYAGERYCRECARTRAREWYRANQSVKARHPHR